MAAAAGAVDAEVPESFDSLGIPVSPLRAQWLRIANMYVDRKFETFDIHPNAGSTERFVVRARSVAEVVIAYLDHHNATLTTIGRDCIRDAYLWNEVHEVLFGQCLEDMTSGDLIEEFFTNREESTLLISRWGTAKPTVINRVCDLPGPPPLIKAARD